MVKETPRKAQRPRKRFHPNLEDKMTIITYYEQLKHLKEVAKASKWSKCCSTRYETLEGRELG